MQTVYMYHILDNIPILISTNIIPLFDSHTLGPYWDRPLCMSDLPSPTCHKPQCTSREEVGHWDMATVHKQEMTTAPQAAPHVTVGLACGHISKEPMASGAPYY